MSKKQNRPRDKVMRRLYDDPTVSHDQYVAMGISILNGNKGREWRSEVQRKRYSLSLGGLLNFGKDKPKGLLS